MGAHVNAPDAAARDVIDSVRRIVRSLRISSRAAERDVGISAAQLFVLTRLDGAPAMSLNELAERTLTHQSSASVVVAKLVRRGLVKRTQSGEDRRRMELSLTPAGRAVLRRSPAAAQDQLLSALQRMPSGDRETLARLLQTFVTGAGMADDPPALLFEDEPGRPSATARRPRKSPARASRG
jgi:DNA-binding MarR family transcriptional regulator